jgi:hypothetical protein
MFGKRSADADHPYHDHGGRDAFDGLLATQRAHLVRDADCAALYCLSNGRPSVPPRLLAIALLLHVDDGVSDEEAKARADVDLRWKVALGVGLDERPVATSTLQLFRAQRMLHDQVRTVFPQSLAFARRTGYVRSQTSTLVLDTSYIRGRAAVTDTAILVADGIVTLVRALATVDDRPAEIWAMEPGLGGTFGASLTGAAAIDWDAGAARQACLRSVVAAADRLRAQARPALAARPTDDPGSCAGAAARGGSPPGAALGA